MALSQAQLNIIDALILGVLDTPEKRFQALFVNTKAQNIAAGVALLNAKKNENTGVINQLDTIKQERQALLETENSLIDDIILQV